MSCYTHVVTPRGRTEAGPTAAGATALHGKPARGVGGPGQGPDLSQGFEQVILGPLDLATPPPCSAGSTGRSDGSSASGEPRAGGAEYEPSSPVGSLCSGKDARGFRDVHELGTTPPFLAVKMAGGAVHEYHACQGPLSPAPHLFVEWGTEKRKGVECWTRPRGRGGGRLRMRARTRVRITQPRLPLSALRARLCPSAVCRVIHLLSPQSITRWYVF